MNRGAVLTLVDHENNYLTLTPNGDASKYGAYIEAVGPEDNTVRVHVTPARMNDIRAWMEAQL